MEKKGESKDKISFSEFKERFNLSNDRANYGLVRNIARDWVSNPLNIDKLPLRDKAFMLGIAERLMNPEKYVGEWRYDESTKTRARKQFEDAYLGAQIYEQLGKSERASKKLNRAFIRLNTLNPSFGEEYPTLISSYTKAIEDFTKRANSSDLSKKFAFISLASVTSGIFFLSPNLTGNVIGTIANKTTYFTGIDLLFMGLITGFFAIKFKI